MPKHHYDTRSHHHIHCIFDKKETTIKSTDLEITVIVKLPASIESTGSVTAPLQMLSNITNELPDETRVNFNVDVENKINIMIDY